VQPTQITPQDGPQEPFVSVIIVSWNCVEALRRCLTALNSSKNRARFEVLVVDAGSRDGSAQMDSEFEGVSVLRLPRNFGKTRCRNNALRASSADLILFLAPEIELAQKTVTDLVAALESDEHAVAAVPALVNDGGSPVPIGARLPDRNQIAELCRENRDLPLQLFAGSNIEVASDAALLVRKSFLRGMNFLDENRYSEYWAELELFWQIRNAGKKLIAVDTPATLHGQRLSVELGPAELSALASDRVAGASAFVGKHDGILARIGFVLAQLLNALMALFRNPAYGFRLIVGILGMNRIDGTQGGVLG
jgi:GT2 family glycosyltransferase